MLKYINNYLWECMKSVTVIHIPEKLIQTLVEYQQKSLNVDFSCKM